MKNIQAHVGSILNTFIHFTGIKVMSKDRTTGFNSSSLLIDLFAAFLLEMQKSLT